MWSISAVIFFQKKMIMSTCVSAENDCKASAKANYFRLRKYKFAITQVSRDRSTAQTYGEQMNRRGGTSCPPAW